jgi:hypothetical protein
MRSRKLKRALGEYHGAGPEKRPEHRRSLEAELLARHGTLYPRKEAWKMILDPRMRSGRLVLASLFILLLGIGACSIPSSYEEEIGQAVQIRMSDSIAREAPDIDAVLAALEGVEGVTNVSVNERISDAGVQVDIMLWGEDLDAEEMLALISQRFPELADAEIGITPLAGTVECNLGDRLMHEFFQFEVEGGDAESIRQQILEQLAAQGHENADVVVDVNEEDGQATIDIEITEEQ